MRTAKEALGNDVLNCITFMSNHKNFTYTIKIGDALSSKIPNLEMHVITITILKHIK